MDLYKFHSDLRDASLAWMKYREARFGPVFIEKDANGQLLEVLPVSYILSCDSFIESFMLACGWFNFLEILCLEQEAV